MQELLGHATLTTTLKVYTHSNLGAKRAAVERVNLGLDAVASGSAGSLGSRLGSTCPRDAAQSAERVHALAKDGKNPGSLSTEPGFVGVDDGFRTRNLLIHSQALCR